MKRTLSAILALLMLLGVACAAIGCSNPVEGDETATTTAAAIAESNIEEVTTDSLYDSNGYLKDDLDPTLNFGGETVNIFAWEHTLPEFYVEEQSGNIVEDAVYTRNANTESRGGVELEFTRDALYAVADKAIERKTGARGLRSTIEQVLGDIMFNAPSDKTISKIVITADAVNGVAEPLYEHDSKALPKTTAKKSEIDIPVA